MKEGDRGRKHGMLGEMRNVHNVLLGKSGGKRALKFYGVMK